MTDIHDLATLRQRIVPALRRMTKLLDQEPDNNWLHSIILQLRYVDEQAELGATKLDRHAELNFGLLASRYVDEVDPPLATELHAISAATRRLFNSNGS